MLRVMPQALLLRLRWRRVLVTSCQLLVVTPLACPQNPENNLAERALRGSDAHGSVVCSCAGPQGWDQCGELPVANRGQALLQSPGRLQQVLLRRVLLEVLLTLCSAMILQCPRWTA